jgi:ribonuclease HII
LFKALLNSVELIDFGVGEVSVEEINQMGIDHANVLAFDRAVKALPTRPNFLVVDGVKGVPGFFMTEMLVEPGADGNHPVVGAASILAKVIRDSLMGELHHRYPQYQWENNKGYGSAAHIAALQNHGPTHHHRSHFIRGIIQSQMELFHGQ